MPILMTIAAIVLGSLTGELEIGLLLGLVVGVFLVQRESRMKQADLEKQIQRLSDQIAHTEAQQVEPQPAEDAVSSEIQEPVEAQTEYQPPQPKTIHVHVPETVEVPRSEKSVGPNAFDRFINSVQQAVVSYFTDGNLFVRVGLLILFFGIAFLLKYAAENSKIPLEFRFLGAAAGGMFLLVMGWRLRHKKEIYALLLQGGGIGVIYITIFASYRIADLIPSTLTFGLLVLFALFTGTLAVLQNSRALAIYAMLGGFLAPFLASSGSGNFIGLFSYYAVLNLAVFGMAWFKSWRLLNLIGFVFTFAIFTLWVIFSYKTADLVPALLFLLLYFLMYSLIGVLYAFKQTQKLKGLVDGTLVFGTPLIASSLLMALVRHLEYGIALGAAWLGLYYVILARTLWKKQGDQLRLLAEAMLAIGVVFATLAIPYSLDGHWTSATWALEAAGILWVSIRQQQFYAQIFALVLQFGAGLLFLMRNVGDLGDTVWLNPSFLGGVFIALGAFISARLLYQLQAGSQIRGLHSAFFVWAMLWWIGTSVLQIENYLDNKIIALLLLFSLSALLLVYLDRIREWNWQPAAISAALLLPVLVLVWFVALDTYRHALLWPDVLVWMGALGISYWIIAQLEKTGWDSKFYLLLHTGFVVFSVCLLSFDLAWHFEHQWPQTGEAFVALLTIFPLLMMYASRVGLYPAIPRLGEALQMALMSSLAALMLLWSLGVNLSNSGNPAPLVYLPFINPLDLAHIVFFISILRFLPLLEQHRPQLKNPLLMGLGALLFIWISAVLLRSMHHYAGVAFDVASMMPNVKVQTALSILWTVIGMLAMLVAARKTVRPLWIAGAVLVGLVLVKMFFIDLGASGTVERIVSFMVVGGLLVAMGYFSPIPEKNGEHANEVLQK